MFHLKADTVEKPHPISQPTRHVRSCCWMRAVSLKLMESFISFFGREMAEMHPDLDGASRELI